MDTLPADQTTFHALQRLEQGRFQALGDKLLPRLIAAVWDLRAHGLSTEGKTRPGVPDSFVGRSVGAATAGVEYTTQATEQAKKAASDYAGVRARAPTAKTIVLVSNRSLRNIDLSSLRATAIRDQVELHIVDGHDLSDALDADHQDLRRDFLGIALGAHSRTSLVATLMRAVDENLPRAARSPIARGVIARPIATGRIVASIQGRSPGLTIVTAPSGAGKTIWSAGLASELASTTPSVWTSARALRLTSPDPIGLAAVQASYGTSDVGRVAELDALLRRHGELLVVWIDGVDEVNDLDAFGLGLKEFQKSRLGNRTRLVMTSREEMRQSVERLLRLADREARAVESGDETMFVTLDRLRGEERRRILLADGVSPADVSKIEATIPRSYLGSPLFLTLAARLIAKGPLPSASGAFRRAAVDWMLDDVVERSRRAGRELRRTVVASVLGLLAWRIISGDSDSIAIDELTPLPDGSDLWRGEGTFLGWVQQAGLVEVADDRVVIRHPVFVEELAAAHLEAQSDHFLQLQRVQSPERLRRLAARLGPRTHDPAHAIDVLRTVDLRAALEVGASLERPLLADGPASVLVGDIDRDLLRSAHESDVRTGIAMLGRLRHPKAASHLVEAFNGSDAMRDTHRFQFAEAFLAHQVVGAARVVLGHRWFMTELYDPAFHERLGKLTPAFLRALQRTAVELLHDDTRTTLHAGALQLLAFAKDEVLLDVLEVAVRERALTVYENRALVLFDTERSIGIYADAVDRMLAEPKEDGMRPGWYACVLLGADVRMFLRISRPRERRDRRDVNTGIAGT